MQGTQDGERILGFRGRSQRWTFLRAHRDLVRDFGQPLHQGPDALSLSGVGKRGSLDEGLQRKLKGIERFAGLEARRSDRRRRRAPARRDGGEKAH